MDCYVVFDCYWERGPGPHHLSVAEALRQLGLQDLLQSALGQLVAAVAAPDVHADRVALRARAACARAAGAEAVGGQVADLQDRWQKM